LFSRDPDGETGVRSDWIAWKLDVFERTPYLELAPGRGKNWGIQIAYQTRSGFDQNGLAFASLGYADATIASYATFARLKASGVIRPSTHFQVCLATPLAAVSAYILVESRKNVEPTYEHTLLNELQEICAAVPHDQLAIQRDTAIEFALLEGVMPIHRKPFRRYCPTTGTHW